MTPTPKQDWNPEAYARFRGLRLQPALDLMGRVGPLPSGSVVDLGCGDGAAGAALSARYGRPVLGVDRSPAMLDVARASGAYQALTQADIGTWQATQAPALIFSNATLHWLPDHAALLPRLARMLTPKGVLAVQMPRQFGAPSHRFLRDFSESMFPDRFDFIGWTAPVHTPAEYWEILSPLGQVEIWETEYLQRLPAATDAHPVRRFTESTAMRPFLEKLNEVEAEAFLRRYEESLAVAYPLRSDGTVLFPFRRLFLTLTV